MMHGKHSTPLKTVSRLGYQPPDCFIKGGVLTISSTSLDSEGEDTGFF